MLRTNLAVELPQYLVKAFAERFGFNFTLNNSTSKFFYQAVVLTTWLQSRPFNELLRVQNRNSPCIMLSVQIAGKPSAETSTLRYLLVLDT